VKHDARQASTLLDLLNADDPIRSSTLTGEGIEAALDEIGGAITGMPRQPPRAARRRSIGGRRTVLVATAVVLISAGMPTKDASLQGFYGSDGTRTRDLRRDRPSRAQRRPTTKASERAHLQALSSRGWLRSAWLSQPSDRRLGHEWATGSCLQRQRLHAAL
jgi:hypothetical protein